MKYKVGDKVKVKSLDWYNENKNQTGQVQCLDEIFLEEMSKLCGRLVTIHSIAKHGYYINEDDYTWTDDMFEETMNNEIRIKVPEGYVIDEENSTFECIKFKKKEVKISKLGSCVLVEHPKYVFSILDKEDLRTDFDSAFKLAKIYDRGATIPTREQWKIIHEHLDEINSFLKNKIEKAFYWTSEEYNSYNSWIIHMGSGSNSANNHLSSYKVRAIKNYKS